MPIDDEAENAELQEQVKLAETQIVEQSKRIEYYLTDYSVELLAMKMGNGQFVIPSYQRDDTWEDDRKSRFIESLLMGLPIPFLFFWEKSDGRLEVVDGSQRLRTIAQFLNGELEIGELTQLTELTGLRFQDLPESRQLKIKNRSIRGIILNEHADEQARFDIFERINTGSKIANKAEVRRGALAGPFLELVIELAQDDLFVKLAPVPQMGVSLRKREEMVTRFFAYSDLYASGFTDYNDRPAEYLFEYAKGKNEELQDKKRVKAFKKRFNETMKFIDKTFPYGFRKSATATQTYYTRFESIAVGSFLAISKKPELKKAPPDVGCWITGDQFKEYSKSGSSNVKRRMKDRFEFVRDKLTEG
ncbi:hypothetical protein Fuma_02029 [Fuerstiella marisgermanici]|uniref:GmrSD restriction endonucleases N-terminal domain-containing protein n=2 Tax=Fuerstiella marisgermanici TaxID=1891926 RepID=A0A1P8WED0_9PLAN|nr:hypothetical protein Fuma_02029 [Fuerstiella marisgermanici]